MRVIQKKKINILPTWLLAGWFLFFVINPFYIFGSGLPQPSDWVMALLFVFFFFTQKIGSSVTQNNLFNKHRAFVIYVVLVNTLWFFFIDQSQEKRFPSFFHSFFYVFNFLTLKACIKLSNAFREKFLRVTLYGVGISLIIQMVLSLLLGSTESRSALFFNNPNQLGYYALLSGSLLIYGVRSVRINSVFQLVAYFSFFYLTLISASKAALAGSIILIALALLNQGFVKIRQLTITFMAVAVGYYFINTNSLGIDLFDKSVSRFNTIGDSRDDTIEGRGYDRILNEPEYLVVGAGEGGYHRFDTLLKAGEIHSSFGTLIFCYGVIGFFLFFRFLFTIFRKSSIFELLYFTPIFAYSITHQGLRDTLFWVFLGVVFILNENKTVGLIKIKQPGFRRNREFNNKTSKTVYSQPNL